MKRFYLIISLLLFICISHAQTSKTIHVEEAGTLKTLLTETELSTVTNLTVTGNIDVRDIKTMRDDMPLLAVLDIGEVNIQEHTGYISGFVHFSTTYSADKMPEYSFCDKSTDPTGEPKFTLTSIILPNSITSIGESAFQGCSNLRGELTIPSSVTSIGKLAFDGCENLLGELTLPKSLTSIGDYAFRQCSGFSSARSLNPTPPAIGSGVFRSRSFRLLYVPSKAVAAYNEASGWSYLDIISKNHVTIDVPNAGKMAATIINNDISSLDSITHLTVTGKINAVDINHMKSNMNALAFIDLSDVAITSDTMPPNAFQNKYKLNTIIFPNSLVSG